MKPQDAFKELLSNLKPFLKCYNFTKKGNSFYSFKENNYGVIAFQKSQTSSASKVVFTINVGIYSKVLAQFFHPEKVKLHPCVADCHWTERAQEKLSPFVEKWWSIDEQTSIDELNEEVEGDIKKLIIEIEDRISDKKLQLLWLSGYPSGTTNVRRLMNLSVLLKNTGDLEQLKLVKDELKKISDESNFSIIINQHLASLEGDL